MESRKQLGNLTWKLGCKLANQSLNQSLVRLQPCKLLAKLNIQGDSRRCRMTLKAMGKPLVGCCFEEKPKGKPKPFCGPLKSHASWWLNWNPFHYFSEPQTAITLRDQEMPGPHNKCSFKFQRYSLRGCSADSLQFNSHDPVCVCAHVFWESVLVFGWFQKITKYKSNHKHGSAQAPSEDCFRFWKGALCTSMLVTG